VNLIPTVMQSYRMYCMRKIYVKIQLDYCKDISKIAFERVTNSKPDIWDRWCAATRDRFWIAELFRIGVLCP